MKKKIGIDFTYIKADEPSGIRKYGEEILEGLVKTNKSYEIILFVDEALLNAFKARFPQYKIVPMKVWFKNIKLLRWINRRSLSKVPKKIKIKREKCDIIIHPYAEKLTPFIKGTKSISGILDVIPLDLIQDKSSRKYQKTLKELVKLMNKTDNIITISEYSKKRLIDINPQYKGKIDVIPCAVAKLKETNKKVEDVIKMKKPFIFSINSFYKHKNQFTLVKAFNIIKDKIQHQLVLVGRPELNSGMSAYGDILKYIDENNLKDRITILSYISDEDRNALFYNTDLFVSTSLQEGFGRTPVEAAMCSVPVISTKETALPEATKDLVYYYNNGTNENELAEKIIEVINNKPSKEKLQQIAKELEEEYSETRIANMYIELIDKII